MKLYLIIISLLFMIGCAGVDESIQLKPTDDKLVQCKMRDIKITSNSIDISFQYKLTWVKYFIIVIKYENYSVGYKINNIPSRKYITVWRNPDEKVIDVIVLTDDKK